MTAEIKAVYLFQQLDELAGKLIEAGPLDIASLSRKFKANLIRHAVRVSGGNKCRAARKYGMGRNTIGRWSK